LALIEFETDSVLVVDSDRILAFTIAFGFSSWLLGGANREAQISVGILISPFTPHQSPITNHQSLLTFHLLLPRRT